MTKTFCDICGNEINGKECYCLLPNTNRPHWLNITTTEKEICVECAKAIDTFIKKLSENSGSIFSKEEG